ncbi:MAG: flagellar filament capping protein FliD [Candidatus Sericytochromatia bacterium]|nr:flagellar filament capping protein FliD [Candidatus Tanganyikabacteria bacterium]
MPIQLSGLASGLDSQALIDQLMKLEAKPVEMLALRKDTLTTKNTAFQAINTKVLALKDKAFALTTDSILKAMLSSSTDEKIVTAKAGPNASPGSYKVTVNKIASSTRATSWGQLGQSVVDTQQLLSDANTQAPITAGRFTLTVKELNGTVDPIFITVNAGDKWSDVFTRINLATGGEVTASLSGNKVVLTADKTRVAEVKTGNADDTSNFLQQTKLDTALYDSATGTVKSSQPVGVVQRAAKLIDAKFATALTATTGSFKINDVQVDWNANTDTVDSLITKINSSGAGVVAAYSAPDDKLVVTNKNPGSKNINFLDVTGNLLQSLRVDRGDQVTGDDAEIVIDGFNLVNGVAQPIKSSSNDFKDVLPGVTITAKKAGEQQTITIDRDKDTTVKAVRDFVTEFNNVVDAIQKAREKGAPNQFDGELAALNNRMMGIVTSVASGISGSPNTLMQIGVGTSKDDRKHLTLNEAKLRSEIDRDRDRVADIFQKQELVGGSTVSRGIAQVLNDYLDRTRSENGIFKLRQRLTDDQISSINETITRQNRLLDMKRTDMVKRFTQMEVAISKLKSQQTSFLSQLGQLAGSQQS